MTKLGRGQRGRTRRQVALACLNEPKTISDLAAEFGREPGSLRSLVTALNKDGVLKQVKLAGARGAAFKTTERYRRELAHPQERAIPGLILPGQRLLAVGTRNFAALADLVLEAAANPAVLWCVRVDGVYRVLIAIDGSQPEELDRLEAQVTAAGGETAYARADVILGPPQMQRYAKLLRRGAPAISRQSLPA
jgi:DNA-binding Lrp family transcriptional regulator